MSLAPAEIALLLVIGFVAGYVLRRAWDLGRR